MNHFKSISYFDYNKGKTKNEKLLYKEVYDTTGAIKSKAVYNFLNGSRTNINFYYAPDGALTRVDSEYVTKSTGDDMQNIDHDIIEFTYNSDHTLKLMKVGNYTLNYVYNKNGTLNYKYCERCSDTVFYHYNAAGDCINDSNKQWDTRNEYVRDKYGCQVFNQFIEDSTLYTDRETAVYDSLCNPVIADASEFSNGKWMLLAREINRYNGKVLTDRTEYNSDDCLNCGHPPKLKFWYHTIYEYTDKGFVSKETGYTKRGKIFYMQKYIYETY